MLDAIMGAPEWVWLIASLVFGAIVFYVTARKDIRNWYNSIVPPAEPNFWERARQAETDRKYESDSSENTLK